jgi:hypothetical protein
LENPPRTERESSFRNRDSSSRNSKGIIAPDIARNLSGIKRESSEQYRGIFLNVESSEQYREILLLSGSFFRNRGGIFPSYE